MNALKKEVQEKNAKTKKTTKKTTTSKKKKEVVIADEPILLSIVVPCYNSSKTIGRLLDSIIVQKDHTMKIETIIQNDGNEDNYLDIVKTVAEKHPEINIKIFDNKPREIHCPGNTRLDGMNNATGKWITFIDHDDMFESTAFHEFQEALKNTNEEHLIVTRFREFDDKLLRYGKEYDRSNITWLHGKFYNINFLKENNIHFKENLKSHEDLFFNQSVFATVTAKNLKFTMVDSFTYKWVFNDDSTSRMGYKTGFFYIDENYQDYLDTAIEPWLNILPNNPNLRMEVFKRVCYSLLFGYFYYQSLYYRRQFKHHRQNRDIFEDTLHKVMDIFGANVDDIARVVYSDSGIYNKIRDESFRGAQVLIEADSFYAFIEKLA